MYAQYVYQYNIDLFFSHLSFFFSYNTAHNNNNNNTIIQLTNQVPKTHNEMFRFQLSSAQDVYNTE